MFRSRRVGLAMLLGAFSCTDEEEDPGLPLAVLAFEEVARESGLSSTYQSPSQVLTELSESSGYPFVEVRERLGGIAAGDIDADGWLDLVVLGGSQPAEVFFGREGGNFEKVASAALQLSPGSLAPLLLDLTGDERPELLVPSVAGNGLQVFENRWPNSWRDTTQRWGLEGVAPSINCAAADVDADGDVDLFLGRWGAKHRADELAGQPLAGLLWLNDSGSRFDDRSDWVELPLVERAPGELVESVIAPRFADVDNDGDLDLWLTADFGATMLLRQDASIAPAADAGFAPDAQVSVGDASNPAPDAQDSVGDAPNPAPVDAQARVGDASSRPHADSGWVDGGDRVMFDAAGGDWRPDGSFLQADGGLSPALLKRALWGRGTLTATGWTEATTPRFRAERGLALAAASNADGVAIGDFDNDGALDWFISGVGLPTGTSEQFRGNRLLRNDGSGGFEDVTEGSGLDSGGWGRESCTEDFDNDGRLDIAQLSGAAAPEYQQDRLRLFLASRREPGVFIEVSEAAGITDAGQGRFLVCVDYDRDGDIDMFVGDADGGLRLLRNRLDPDQAYGANYFGVRLVGKAPNTAALGARVSVRVGATQQLREVQASSGQVVHGVSTLHFGVGTARRLDELAVTWPDGEEQAIGGLGANDLVVIRQPN